MMTACFRTLFLTTLVLVPDFAVAGVLTGELDKAAGSLDDEFIYTLTASGDVDGDPDFPKIEGLQIRSMGTSSNFSIINGKMSREQQYRYVIVPERAGTFLIPPVSLEVDDEVLKTLPITFKVIEGAAAGPQEGTPLLMVERTLINDQPYIGEQVVGTVRIYHRRQLLQADVDVPETPGVNRLPLEGEKTYTKVVNGETYGVIEIKEIFIPGEAGKKVLKPFAITTIMPEVNQRHQRGFFDDFFNRGPRVKKKARSKELTLAVKALPETGRPDSYADLVGEFKLNASVSRKELNAGDTTTLTVVIEGTGLVEGMKEPALAFDQSLKVYADKPISEQTIDRERGIESRRTFKYALVPTKPGTFDLGELAIGYFNTKTDVYEVLKAPLGALTVGGSPTTDASLPPPSTGGEPKAKEEVQVLGQDIIDLHRGAILEVRNRLTSKDSFPLTAIVCFGALAAALGFTMGRFRRDAAKIKRWHKVGQASRHYFKESEKARAALRSQKPEDGISILHSGFRRYIGDKFDLRGSALTTSDVERKLRDLGLDDHVVRDTRQVLEHFDRLEYSGTTPVVAEAQQLVEKLNSIVKELERKC